MLSRRACLLALTSAAAVPRARAATARANRLALLLVAPWEKETFLGNDLKVVQEGLRARGLADSEMIGGVAQVDRPGLSRRLDEVRRRIASWQEGEVFLFYSGHGMYRRSTNPLPEPGLQLTADRDHAVSAMLWREVFTALALPPRVRLLVLPDCCHTNLLAGRLPANVTALIMKSTPQGSLVCRTGTALFDGARGGVISHYAGRTLSGAATVQDWLAAIDAAAKEDIAAGKLRPGNRVPLIVEGPGSAGLIGQPVA